MILRMKFPAAALAASMFLSAPVWAQPLDEGEAARVNAVLADLGSPDEPGVAVGMVRGGEIVLERYVGLADMSNRIPLDADSRINIASNAKQYVGLMVLEMARAGTIDLDADFRTYLPDAMPLIEERLTVAELLTHTSGIRDVYDLWALTGITWYRERLRNREAMDLLNRQRELNFAPGSEYLYSNSNYILLAEMIEAVSGEEFEDYAAGFFDRLGMESTGWKASPGSIVPDIARAYGKYDGWLEDPATANMHGDGFLFTTLGDQLNWERQLQGAGSALSEAMLAQSQQRPSDALPGNYGFGLEISDYRGLAEISHVGSTGGYNAYVRRFPEQDLAIVVMGNTTEIGVVALGRALSDAILADSYGEGSAYPTGPAVILARPANADVIGRYRTAGGTIITIVERDGDLFREIEGRDPARLIHERGNLFEYETVEDLKIAFDRSETDERRFRIFYPGQAVATALTFPAPGDDDAAKRALEGRYVNAESDTEIVIAFKGANAFTMTKNGSSGDATLVSPDLIQWNNYQLRFERGEDGSVEKLLVDSNRIRSVSFEPAPADAR